MAKELIINASLPEVRIALVEDGKIQELLIERQSEKGIVGNIYKGRVTRVLPGMQAAFVDIGLEKAAFLYVDDVFLDHHKIGDGPSKASLEAPGKSSGIKIQLKSRSKVEAGESSASLESDSRSDASGDAESAPIHQEDALQASSEQATDGVDLLENPARFTDADDLDEDAFGVKFSEDYADLEDDVDLDIDRDLSEGSEEANENAEHEPLSEPAALLSSEPEPSGTGDEVEVAGESESPVLTEASGESEEVKESDELSPVKGPKERKGRRPARKKKTATTSRSPDRLQKAFRANDAEVESSSSLAQTLEADDSELESDRAMIASEDDAMMDTMSARSVVVASGEPMSSDGAASVNARQSAFREQRGRDRRIKPKAQLRPRDQVNIQDILKEGQEVLVQVAKDPISTKGARLTCHMSLPGRHLVCMPTVDHVGVSRRIEKEDERRTLRDFVERHRPKSMGFIVRTASSGKDPEKWIKQDVEYLTEVWRSIRDKAENSRAPSMVYEDMTSIIRAIRDWVNEDIDRIRVDSRFHYNEIMDFAARFMPHLSESVELYHGDVPIFDAYSISTEINRSLERKVWLKSGGSIVIDQAEALVAIDVNTGRYVGKRSLEETIVKTNLEAAEEIAYQLRLRNCGGIIIIDFIDMEREESRHRVYRAFEEALKKDRARPSILKISELGLVEMTRKRTRDTMVRAMCESCNYCEGRGYVKSKQTVAYQILREIEREGVERNIRKILVQAHPDVINHLAIDDREILDLLERRYRKAVYLQAVPDNHIEQFEVSSDRGAEVAKKAIKSIGTRADRERGSSTRENTDRGDRNNSHRDGGRDSKNAQTSERAPGTKPRLILAADRPLVDPSTVNPEGGEIRSLEGQSVQPSGDDSFSESIEFTPELDSEISQDGSQAFVGSSSPEDADDVGNPPQRDSDGRFGRGRDRKGARQAPRSPRGSITPARGPVANSRNFTPVDPDSLGNTVSPVTPRGAREDESRSLDRDEDDDQLAFLRAQAAQDAALSPNRSGMNSSGGYSSGGRNHGHRSGNGGGRNDRNNGGGQRRGFQRGRPGSSPGGSGNHGGNGGRFSGGNGNGSRRGNPPNDAQPAMNLPSESDGE